MLDVKLLRDDPDAVKAMLGARNNDLDLSRFVDLDRQRRDLITRADQLKQERKATSKKIGAMMKSGEDPTEIKARVAEIGETIKELDAQLAQTENDLNDLLSRIPNMLDADTPIGKGEEDNVEVARWGRARPI